MYASVTYLQKIHSLARRPFINQKRRANFKSPSAAFWQCNKSVCPLVYKKSFNVRDNRKKNHLKFIGHGRCRRRSSGLNDFWPHRTKPIWLIIIQDHMCVYKLLLCIMMCTVCSVKTLITLIQRHENNMCFLQIKKIVLRFARRMKILCLDRFK